MIFNTYFTSVMLSIGTMYAGSSVFFNNCNRPSIYLFSCGSFSTTILSLMRLFYLTNSSQNMGMALRKSLRTLDQLKMENDGEKWKTYERWKLVSARMKLLRNELKCHYDTAISPFSAFGLSNGTLVGTFATILTYLIVLIQFKATENQQDHLCANTTVSEI